MGSLIAISAGPLTSDIFLLDRNQLQAKARDLTNKEFDSTAAVDISLNGDVIFSNFVLLFHEIPPIKGLRLITNEELKNVNPHSTLT